MAAALRSVPGVIRVEVSWQAGRAAVRHAAETAVVALIRAVEAASEGTPHTYRARLAERGRAGLADAPRE